MAVARKQLETMIAVNGQHEDAYSKYLTAAARRGLLLLDGGEVGDTPVIVSAGVGLSPDGSAKMGLIFFDAAFRTRGIVVGTESGFRQQYPVFDWTSDDKEWYLSTIVRHEAVNVRLGGLDQPVLRARRKSTVAAISLPREVLRERLRVGLLTEAGRETSMIEACIWKVKR